MQQRGEIDPLGLPVIDGALDVIKKSGKGIKTHTIATGAAVPAEAQPGVDGAVVAHDRVGADAQVGAEHRLVVAQPVPSLPGQQ